MTNKKIDEELLKENLEQLFQLYRFSVTSFQEICIVDKIQADIKQMIKDSYQ